MLCAHMSGIHHDTQLARASVHNRGSRVADVPIYDGRGLAIGGVDTMQCGVVHDLYWSVVTSY